MTIRQALEIIEIQERGEHEYLLVCKDCGETRPVSTDSPNDLLLMMAAEHKRRHKINV